MKACLMKVNYDPKFITPHSHPNKPYESLQARLNITKDIYGRALEPVPNQKRKSGDELRRMKLKDTKVENSSSKISSDSSSLTSKDGKSASTSSTVSNPNSQKEKPKGPTPMKARGDIATTKDESLKTPFKLKPIKCEEKVSYSMLWPRQGTHLTRLFDGPYGEKLPKNRITTFNTSGNVYANQRRSVTSPVKTAMNQTFRTCSSSSLGNMLHQRSRTAPDHGGILSKIFKTPSMVEMERKAKAQVERAIKCRKVFMILGPYPSLRMSLRRRGWVEKFPNAPSPADIMKKAKYVEDDENKPPPWEEENGFYGTMSYMVRNCTPTFVFTVKSNDVDSRVTKGCQLVNHFGKARNFTTKAGLIQNLRQLHWYNSIDPDNMYPRSYKLDEPEERDAFLEDYRVTSCISFVRYFVKKSEELLASEKEVKEEKKPDRELLRCYYQPITKPQMLSDISINTQVGPAITATSKLVRKKSHPNVNIQFLLVAMEQCERLLEEKIHQDIDLANLPSLSTSQWGQFLAAYYQFVHEDGNVSPMEPEMVEKCNELLIRIKEVCPQYIVDGTKNAWIVKPGAKSRGRGIQCLDKLESIQSMMDCADGCMVVQKYIEEPFLVYNTKFDIRQWFLVTDWNPLTIWFYKHCYLRFCSQEFTLDNLHNSIHLSNNAIQKHFTPAGFRCDKLPDDNMWTSDQFVDHLRRKGRDSEWFEVTLPGMKEAIISTLLCTQEFIETRKSAFELYGADFMMTDDMQPWLLEVNSSPSMSQSTRATEKLVEMVLEDTVKVVLDRRDDKQAKTGCFEMIYRQSYINDPLPTDPGLTIHGRRVTKPHQRHR